MALASEGPVAMLGSVGLRGFISVEKRFFGHKFLNVVVMSTLRSYLDVGHRNGSKNISYVPVQGKMSELLPKNEVMGSKCWGLYVH